MVSIAKSLTVPTSDYDRQKELNLLDETKAGVKGLVDSGVTKIPRIFITPPDNLVTVETSNNIHSGIPVIDLAAERNFVIQEVSRAAGSWGFFQVVNHGIPESVLDEVIVGVRRFHEQPNEIKSKYYTRDMSQKVVYNCNFDLYQAPATNWRDTFIILMAPDPVNPEDIPIACRDILIEYTNHIMELGIMLLELISEALGLKPTHLYEMDCDEGIAILGHYYPACPEPELTLGASKHADNDFLTILLQDKKIGGLQVLCENQWYDVPPVPGALVINIGDLLQASTSITFIVMNRIQLRFSSLNIEVWRSLYRMISLRAVNIECYQIRKAQEYPWHLFSQQVFDLQGIKCMVPLRSCYQLKTQQFIRRRQ